MLSWYTTRATPVEEIQAQLDSALDKIARASAVLAKEDIIVKRTVAKLKPIINEAQAILAE